MGSFGQGVFYYDPPMNWVIRYINMLVSCPSKFSELLYLYYTGFLSFSERNYFPTAAAMLRELPPTEQAQMCSPLILKSSCISQCWLPLSIAFQSHIWPTKNNPTTHLSKISGILWICWQDHWILSELICSAKLIFLTSTHWQPHPGTLPRPFCPQRLWS